MKELVYSAVLVMALVSAGCIGQKNKEPPTSTTVSESTTTLLDDARILATAEENPDVKDFLAENPAYTYEITVLAPENLTALAGKYPALYGGLPDKTLYRIDYSSGNRGVLVIVDFEEEKVLKYFRAVGVSLS